MSAPHPDRPLSQDEVARILAEAGGPVPTPPVVVERLDGVLAGLVTEREAPPAAVRRHRRRGVLLAAAALVVAGVGATSLLDRDGVGTSDDAGGGRARTEAGSAADEVPSTASGDAAERLPGDVVVLRSATLERDVRAALPAAPRAALRADADTGGCAPQALAPGQRWRPATYDGRPAVLVTSDPTRFPVTAAVLSCGGAELAGVTLRRD